MMFRLWLQHGFMQWHFDIHFQFCCFLCNIVCPKTWMYMGFASLLHETALQAILQWITDLLPNPTCSRSPCQAKATGNNTGLPLPLASCIFFQNCFPGLTFITSVRALLYSHPVSANAFTKAFYLSEHFFFFNYPPSTRWLASSCACQSLSVLRLMFWTAIKRMSELEPGLQEERACVPAGVAQISLHQFRKE